MPAHVRTALAICVLCVAMPIWAQPGSTEPEQPRGPVDLEAEMLRSQAARFQEELARAREEIRGLRSERDALRVRVADLERALRALHPSGGETAPPAKEARAPTPADPLASPESLLATLRERFAGEAHMTQLPRTTERDARTADRELARWCRLTRLKLRGQSTWRVRVELLDDRTRFDRDARVRVIDPASGLPIGEAFRSTLPIVLASRVEDAGTDLFDADVLIIADPTINAKRIEPGLIDEPPLIGPRVEFHYDLQWMAMVPAEEATGPTDPYPAPPDGR